MAFETEFQNGIPFIMEGQVLATDDPDQMGRVRVWIPSLDGENFDVEELPWADYASPFAGFTVEFPAGVGEPNQSQAAYGFWAIPKVGSTVFVFCVNANPAARCYFASSNRLHHNRSLPAGRNTDFNGKQGPWGDDGDESGSLSPINPAFNNLRAQFNQKVTAPEALSRGAWERSVAQGKTDKDGKDGYAWSAVDKYLDPQTYCIVTPGRHAIIMQDHKGDADSPAGSRLRFKTAEGHQIIFDDTNERIYMSTAHGRTWVELDQDGHVHIFGEASVSISAGIDVNISATRNVNIEAGKSVNIKADDGDVKVFAGSSVHVKALKDIKQSACGIFDIDSESSLKMTAASNLDILSSADVAITGASALNLKSGGDITETASNIHLNGPSARGAESASCPDLATSPPIVPTHEPWTRPPLPTAYPKRQSNYWKK